MGMEIYRDIQVFLQQPHQPARPQGRNQPGHVLDGNHVGAHSLKFQRFIDVILVCKDMRLQRFGLQQRLQPFEPRKIRIYGVADGAIGNAAVFFHRCDGRPDVVGIIQGIENPHNADAGSDGVPVKPVNHIIRIRIVTKEISSARQGGELHGISDALLNLFKPVPGIFIQVAHHRVGHRPTPYFHGIKAGFTVQRQYPVNLLLGHAGGKQRLLSVA